MSVQFVRSLFKLKYNYITVKAVHQLRVSFFFSFQKHARRWYNSSLLYAQFDFWIGRNKERERENTVVFFFEWFTSFAFVCFCRIRHVCDVVRPLILEPSTNNFIDNGRVRVVRAHTHTHT